MKQTGNVLLVLLVLMAVIASISIDLFTSSLQEFKASEHYHQRQEAFYQTEQCLQQTLQGALNERSSQPLLDLTSKSRTWWQRNGRVCGKDRWYLLQSVTAQTLVLSIYHQKHILLQAILRQNTDLQWRLVSWSQLY